MNVSIESSEKNKVEAGWSTYIVETITDRKDITTKIHLFSSFLLFYIPLFTSLQLCN